MSDSVWPHRRQPTWLPCPWDFPVKNSGVGCHFTHTHTHTHQGFPGGSEVKASARNAGDLGSIPGSGRSPGEENGNPLQHSCLENPMDGGAWWAIVHGVAKSWARLSDFTFTCTHTYDILGFPGVASYKELAYQCSRPKGWEFDPWVRKIPCRKKWQSTPVFLPGQATVHRVAQSQAWLKQLSMHSILHEIYISTFKISI